MVILLFAGLGVACADQERHARTDSTAAPAAQTPAKPAPTAAVRDPPRRAQPAKTKIDPRLVRHLAALRRRAGAGFHIVVEPPFVVVGDESPATVRARSKQTVRWAVDHLKALYFKKDPKAIIDVWLFRDRASYLQHNKRLWNTTPGTPFGYYSDTHRVLVMNIATGGGTLVHEIVHPFIEANFPTCPSWFNEGLGSLYEQCGRRNGRIWGFTNWRLAGLQRAIRAGGLTEFKTLIHTTTDQFYQDPNGTNYAQARYLLYYLQYKGLLVKYYHAFVKAAASDPSGWKTLKRILGVSDMRAFQRRWEKFVLGLKFP